MRRWNGWSEDGASPRIPDEALRLLATALGPGRPQPDARFEDVVAAVPDTRLGDDPTLSTEPADRVRHARGQSLPDWIALRSGRLGWLPDAVARPTTDDDVHRLFTRADRAGAILIPYGGGTSVVGGVTPAAGEERPAITVATEALSGLRGLDEASGLATFGAGTVGPDVEAALSPHGLTLGHFPQSWERSTVGGWVAARSAGQQSIGFGRIEALFAGGRLVAPAGTVVMPPHPASAAGPDLRQLVLGSEGRFGIVTETVLRTVPRPAREALPAWFLPDWPRALACARAISRAGLPLSMARLSTPVETDTLLALGGRPGRVRALRGWLRLRGVGPEPSLLLVAASGPEKLVELAVREVGSLVRRHGGTAAGGSPGRQWLRTRFRTPDLRDALWDAGYAIETLETAADWSRIGDLATTVPAAITAALTGVGERVHAFSHLSHLYPSGSSLYVTCVFRLADDPDQTLDRWRRLKAAASDAIVAGGGTISHQHGVGRDHAPYLGAEKGELGLAVLADVARRFDPEGRLNPGVLIEEDGR
ncbi:MAG TPA: FAD-binding oxidoreductase [Candidatus Limnocylindrales bacterium]|nr:FAD-binding oxidoreductase [Candidatus Limnocylindrales bacterium]